MEPQETRSICEWCGEPFERPHQRGPAPKFCSDAHRQASHRAGGSSRSSNRPADLATRVLRHRTQIKEIAARRSAGNVRLFGSVARGEATRDSDVDLLVDLDDSVGLLGLAGLQRELVELLGVPVDVVPASQLKPAVEERVASEAIAL